MKNTSAHAKFTFDTVFSATQDVMSEGARTRQKKNYSVGDIEGLQSEAYAQGMQASETRALESIAAEVQNLGGVLRQVLANSASEIEALRAEAANLAFALAKKLSGHALSASPMEEVEAALRDAMHQAIGEPRLAVRANPKVAEALKPEIERIAHEEGFEGRVLLAADPHFAAADCRMEWRGGGAERSQDSIESALAEIIERRFSSTSTKE